MTAASCVLASASPASAGTPGPTVHLGASKGFEYKKATYFNVVTQTSQPVDCDPGTEAIGGGGAISDPRSTTALNESYPTLPGPSGWTVEGSGPNARTLTAYAICSDSDVFPKSVQMDVPAGASITNTATCDTDDFAAGGGIQASNSGVVINQSYPPQPQGDTGTWFGGAQNLANDERVVTYHATCDDDYLVAYRSESVRVPKDENGKVSVSCGRRQAVIGGGLATRDDGVPATGPRTNVSRPIDTGVDGNEVPDDGWRAQVFNDSSSAVRLHAHAVCMRGMAA